MQQFRFQIKYPAHPRQWAAFAAILLCRCLLLLFLIYTLLALASLLTSPFGYCSTLTGLCSCSCQVAMPDAEWNAFYHPGANTPEVRQRTVRPATVDDENLCGVCEANWPACRHAAEAQGFPTEPTHTNISGWLTCYMPVCVSGVRDYYGPELSKPSRQDPDKDACHVAQAIDRRCSEYLMKCA